MHTQIHGWWSSLRQGHSRSPQPQRGVRSTIHLTSKHRLSAFLTADGGGGTVPMATDGEALFSLRRTFVTMEQSGKENGLLVR